ncbi:hypothetical protein [Solidesulfovibrio sp.]
MSKERFICIACDGPAPGIHVIVHTIICKRCIEKAGFDTLKKCFWCHEEKLCHRFSHPSAPGQGILLMCQDCRDDFLRRIAVGEISSESTAPCTGLAATAQVGAIA